jgi:thiamine-phosphate pyrophosphorylase
MKGLYLVTPDWDDTEKLLAASEAALQGVAALFQYRHKTASAALRAEQAGALLALCRQYRVPMIVNDHLDLCQQIDADGLHVGGTDATVATVREALGTNKIVGASCYGDMQLARNTVAAGASYIAFGGFYLSRVKKYPVTTAMDIIAQAKKSLTVPVCVIGGMTSTNAQPLIAQGADMVAAISSVYQAADPRAAAQEFVQLFQS